MLRKRQHVIDDTENSLVFVVGDTTAVAHCRPVVVNALTTQGIFISRFCFVLIERVNLLFIKTLVFMRVILVGIYVAFSRAKRKISLKGFLKQYNPRRTLNIGWDETLNKTDYSNYDIQNDHQQIDFDYETLFGKFHERLE